MNLHFLDLNTFYCLLELRLLGQWACSLALTSSGILTDQLQPGNCPFVSLLLFWNLWGWNAYFMQHGLP
jgi:hypothetical protein